MTFEQIDHIFSYHKPAGGQRARYGLIRETARRFAHDLNDMCPDSREKSLALTSLQQTVMWANASIAINEEEKGE